MKNSHIGQYLIAFLLPALVLVGGYTRVISTETCPMGMVYIPESEFFAGTSEKEFLYVNRLCNMTVGGCYSVWFKNEMPRRAVSVKAFCIDRYEYPNKQGRRPTGSMDFSDAVTYCERTGKRLCTEIEWERACAGIAENIWSYGYTYRDKACNEDSGSVVAVGSRPDCRSIEGAFDMNGNLAEWVVDGYTDTSTGRTVAMQILKGGSYRDKPVFTRCNFVDIRDPKDKYSEFGVRCCYKGVNDSFYDPDPEPIKRSEPEIMIEPLEEETTEIEIH